ncbi:hypothetical protein NC653_018622 [Populus alba x Populus x berolinensis]|uniref:Gnk2-homologous domain-containing protein n=1 Tax=Populus alba x Populus x berolinensis TaxID=444605 RepID=A0AAD6QGT6_9ROSI|nr:hypothetical protein NC653_018622 [Populus alba x Populus x berolinensis]
MGSKTIVSLLLHVIIVSITLTDAQMICYTTGNFTANSTYAKNRDLALRSLASNVTNNGGFYNTTIGLGNDTVYGLVLCMASPSAENCSSCVNDAIRTLMAGCPNQKEAISWGGNPVPCIVHYGNRYFLGSLELSPTEAGYNTGIIYANFRQFLQIWSGLMTDTVTIASTSSSRLMPAAETADLSSSQKIYVFMQCTPDVSPSNCSVCLQHCVDYYKSCCNGYQGGYARTPNCFFRWDLYPFYDLFPQVTSPPPSPSPSPSPPFVISSPPPTNTTIRKGKENTASRTVIVTIVPTAIFLALEAKARGQNGYIAPEYARKRQFSVKSDVFSFGVLVLEIVSGQKPSFQDGDDIEHLTSHAWRRWREGTALDLIDPILRNDSAAAMMRCIHIGLLCVQENVADRPTMAAVVLMLSNSSFTLQIPSKPAFFISRRTDQPASSLISYTSRMTQSQLKTVPPSKNEISITELDPR